jgi:hypothetical protein
MGSPDATCLGIGLGSLIARRGGRPAREGYRNVEIVPIRL